MENPQTKQAMNLVMRTSPRLLLGCVDYTIPGIKMATGKFRLPPPGFSEPVFPALV
jgi:hypothetical protein